MTYVFPKAELGGFYVVDLFNCDPFLMFHLHDCPRARDILDRRTFEPTSMKIWCQLAKDATGIMDIGAQVGVYSLAAASLRRDIVIDAYEPNPDAYARLCLHIKANKFENILPHREALSSRAGVVPFSWINKGHISSGGSIGQPTQQTDKFTTVYVRSRPLDEMRASPIGPRGLIKIDVEGAEAMVIAGMARVLSERPDIIIESFSAPNCNAITRELAPMGYSFYRIEESTGGLVATDGLKPADPKGNDYNSYCTANRIPILP